MNSSSQVHTEVKEINEKSNNLHGNDGKRFNRVNTLGRIYSPTPRKVKGHMMPSFVDMDEDIHKVALSENQNGENDEENEKLEWLLDDTLGLEQGQQDLYMKVNEWFQKRVEAKAGHLTVMTCGGQSSGKTYTLFGPSGDPGILPRFVDDLYSIFHNPYVYMSAFLLEGEEVVDLFDPLKDSRRNNDDEGVQDDGKDEHEEAFINFKEDSEEEKEESDTKRKGKKNAKDKKKAKGVADAKGEEGKAQEPKGRRDWSEHLFRAGLGPEGEHVNALGSAVVEALTTMACTGHGSDSPEEEARRLLSQAIRTASVVVAQSNRAFYSASLIVRLIVVDNSKLGKSVRVVNFVEIAPFGCPDACSTTENRLAGASDRHQGVRLVRDAGRQLPRNATLKQMQVHKSFLTFYLQDSLFYRSDCYLIGCIRGVEGALDENFRTLDFLNRVDILSDDSAPVVVQTPLTALLASCLKEAEDARDEARKFKENTLRQDAQKERRRLRALEAGDGGGSKHQHHRAHEDMRHSERTMINKFKAFKRLAYQLDGANAKRMHARTIKREKKLTKWLEMWGVTRTKRPLWPSLKDLKDPSFTVPHNFVSPGQYLVPLSHNGLAEMHGWIGLEFGYTLVSSLRWNAGPDEVTERLEYGRTDNIFTPSLKQTLSAAVREADDDDDDEAFDRFVAAARSNATPVLREGGEDGEYDQEEGELFRTLLVHGEDMATEHCVLQCVSGEVKMRTVLRENGTHTVVSVNGEQVRGVSDLRDGDVVAFGVTQMFKVCQVSPGNADAANDQDDEDEEEMWSDTDSEEGAAKDKKKAINQQQDRRMLHYSQKKQQRPLSLKRYAVDTDLTAYEHACRQAMLPSLIDSWRHVMSDTLHQEHMGVDRPMVAIAKTADKPKVPSSYTPSREQAEDEVLDDMSPLLQARLCEMSLAGRALSVISLTMSRDCMARLQLKSLSQDEYRRRARHSGALCWYMGQSRRPFAAEIVIKTMDAGDEVGLWSWSRFTFVERYVQAIKMAFHFHEFMMDAEHHSKNIALENLEKMYPMEDDPFYDIPGDELIGVGYVYLDSLQYMLDLDENIPLVNFKGLVAGNMRILARIWIDEVTVEPPYVSADEEMRLENYFNHTCHIRLHIQSLQGISASVCCKTRAEFKFFFHGKKYRTPEHAGYAPNPLVDHTLAITQKITPDFLDFLQSGSLEVEVWGRHVSPLAMKANKEPDSRNVCKHLHLGDPRYHGVVDSDDEGGQTQGTDDENDSESDDDDVEALKAKIEVLQMDLETTTRQLQRSSKALEKYESKSSWGFGKTKKGKNSSFFGGSSSADGSSKGKKRGWLSRLFFGSG